MANTTIKVKRQTTNGKNICNAIYKEFLKINKKINNLIGKKWSKDTNRNGNGASFIMNER